MYITWFELANNFTNDVVRDIIDMEEATSKVKTTIIIS
jgi:hypothetical protein